MKVASLENFVTFYTKFIIWDTHITLSFCNQQITSVVVGTSLSIFNVWLWREAGKSWFIVSMSAPFVVVPNWFYLVETVTKFLTNTPLLWYSMALKVLYFTLNLNPPSPHSFPSLRSWTMKSIDTPPPVGLLRLQTNLRPVVLPLLVPTLLIAAALPVYESFLDWLVGISKIFQY